MAIDVVGMPICREADGLAMSRCAGHAVSCGSHYRMGWLARLDVSRMTLAAPWRLS